jgi:hypothetical protein
MAKAFGSALNDFQRELSDGGPPIHLPLMQSICKLFCGMATPNQPNFLIIGKKFACNKIFIAPEYSLYFSI